MNIKITDILERRKICCSEMFLHKFATDALKATVADNRGLSGARGDLVIKHTKECNLLCDETKCPISAQK